MIGQTISHYKITEKLGEGGMGVVYKAEDLKLQRPVALKFLPPNSLGNEEAKARFLREARAAAALHHPNICTVYEIDEANGQTFIAMAYLEGDELTKRIEKGPLTLERLLDVAIQAARGLQQAHSKGVVHRDIKPANIMDTKSGQAVLMDFGLAQLASAASKLTHEGTTIGTSAYMSPEQTTGEKLDHRTDIWALGVVLYEMATAQTPFQGHYEQAILYSILHDPPEPITAARTDTPPELERIINKCLAKKAAERYQTVSDLLADLSALRRRAESGAGTRPSSGAKDTRPSIAVLPFENRSRGEEDEYFSDGISEDITSALGKVEGLQVAPRSMAFQFKGKRPTPREVGAVLNVGHVLEGSVRRSGNRVRINVELIAIDEGYQVWSERYDRVMEDIFEIQDEISQAIVENLKVKLVGRKKEALAKRYTENVQAYNLCLQGRYYWYRRTPEAFQMAIGFYEQALAEDPDYALSHAGLADCHTLLGFYGALPTRETMPRAEAAALKALQIDPDLAAAYASIGAVECLYHWNWAAGEREFQRAIELDAAYPVAHFWYSAFSLAPRGRLDEAYSECKRAAELDPVTQVVNMGPLLILVLQRKYDQAIEELQKMLELEPNYFWTHYLLGTVYLTNGEYDKAIAALDQGNVPPFRDGHLGYAYAVSGQPEKARTLIEELQAGSQPEHLAPYHLAMIPFGLGEEDIAFEWLDKACELRSPQLVWINVGPELDSVRSDPRFQDILRRMNLAD
jgi:serine/threonine-protein kinase